MLKLWGRVTSINVQKVLWVLDELGVPYERVDAGLAFGVVNEPFYRRMNPNGRVPTIEDDGLVLWESNAIVRYLAARHGGALWPADLRVRADADRWMDWTATTFGPAMTPVFWQLVRTPPEKRDAAVIAAGEEQSGKLMELFDGCLAGRQYVAGAAFTMGDIPIGAFVHRWYALPIRRPRAANVDAYYARLKARPAYAKHVAKPLS